MNKQIKCIYIVLKKLSGTHWGANSKILKTIYIGAVQPSLKYGANAWVPRRTPINCSKHWLEDNPWCHENHSHIVEMEKTAGVEPFESRIQARLLIHTENMKTILCTNSSKIPQKTPKQTQTEKEKLKPPNKRTAERTWRHPYNWCTPLWQIKPKQLATRNPTSWDQDIHPWHHFKGKLEWSSFEGSSSGREAKESSLPHRLTISSASPYVRWIWTNAKETYKEHQHPHSVYLYCSSENTSTHWH